MYNYYGIPFWRLSDSLIYSYVSRGTLIPGLGVNVFPSDQLLWCSFCWEHRYV